MVKAKLIGYLAIYLIFWKNIAAIAVSVISLYFSFKYILLKKQSADRLFIKKVKLKAANIKLPFSLRNVDKELA